MTTGPDPTWTVADDAAGDPTLWHGGTAVLRPTDMACPSEYRHRLWAVLTAVLTSDEAMIERLAEAMHDRLRWASIHWSTQRLDREAAPHLVRAVLAALTAAPGPDTDDEAVATDA